MRTMRTYFVLAAAAASALAVAAAAIGGETVQSGVKQTFDVNARPSKLPANDFQGIGAKISVEGCFVDPGTEECSQSAVPANPDASRVLIILDRKNVILNTTEAKKCKLQGNADQQADQLANLPPDQAKQACGSGSVVGKGNATAQSVGQDRTEIPAQVTAFNGKPKGGKPTILLHAFSNEANTGTVPVGVVKARNKIDISVDPLLGGAARLREFTVTIKKDDYVQGSCPDKKISNTSKWQFRDVPGETITVKDTQNCTKKG
jgi:hypothetical protein